MKKHSLAGGIWLSIIGGFAFSYAFLMLVSLAGNSFGESEALTLWAAVVFAAIIAVVCLPIGIVLIVIKVKQNKQVEKYYREHPEKLPTEKRPTELLYTVSCPKCNNQMIYSKRDIRRHRKWRTGYIVCYRCRRPFGVDPQRDEPVPQGQSDCGQQPK